jgi:MFS family permease
VKWVVAAYLLASAMTLITGGRLGDIAGRRRMLRAGLVVFTRSVATADAGAASGTSSPRSRSETRSASR